MASYNTITAGMKDADSPINVTLIDWLDNNATAIAEGATGAPKIQSAALDSNVITQAKMADSSVGQAELVIGSFDDTIFNPTQSVTTIITSTGGAYAFSSQFYMNDDGYWQWGLGSPVGIVQATSYNSLTRIYEVINTNSGGGNDEFIIQEKYVNASPPHKIHDTDYDLFMYARIDNLLRGFHVSDDPPWYHNGPTSIYPHVTVSGKKYRKIQDLENDIVNLKKTDPEKYYRRILESETKLVEIDYDHKNQDMNLLPSPYPASKEPVVIIAPDQDGAYVDACKLHKMGENVGRLINNGYLIIDNDPIDTAGKPAVIPMHKIKWRNSKA